MHFEHPAFAISGMGQLRGWLRMPSRYSSGLKESKLHDVKCELIGIFGCWKDARGKTVTRNVGLKPIQRDGLEFEFDVWWAIWTYQIPSRSPKPDAAPWPGP